jgi:prepilin-type processing-associated H-X9-DG protein
MGNAQRWMTDGGGSVTTTLADVRRTGDTIMLAEKLHKWTTERDDYGNTITFGPGCIVTGVDWWEAWSPGLIPDGSRAPVAPGAANGPNGGLLPAHQNLVNFAFADGHVKAMDPKNTNPNGTTQPQNNMWDAYRN